MPTLPTSLALASIADGSLINAADHRNNNAAVQTAVNALIAGLTGGTTGQVLSTVGTTILPATPPGYEYAYAEVAADATVTATVEATSTSVVTAPAVTFDGSTQVVFEFFSPAVASNAVVDFRLVLFDGAAPVGWLYETRFATTGVSYPAVCGKRKATPSAASHTFSVRGFSGSAATVTVHGGTAAAGAYTPIYLRITKA